MLSFDANSNTNHERVENKAPDGLNFNSLSQQNEVEQQTPTHSRNNFTDMHSLASNWQDDGMGNLVGLDGDRLVTRNEKGQVVDYDEYIESKRSSTHQDMALTSMMMINPFMIFGLGAGMSFMNDSYMNQRQKRLDQLKSRLKGNSRNISSQDSDEHDLQQRINGAHGNRFMSTIEAYHFVNSFNQPRKDVLRKQRQGPNFEEMGERLKMNAAASARKSLSIQKLVKEKLKIQDTIEKMRGKATLEEMSKLYSQIEVLDRAIKNTQEFL